MNEALWLVFSWLFACMKLYIIGFLAMGIFSNKRVLPFDIKLIGFLSLSFFNVILSYGLSYFLDDFYARLLMAAVTFILCLLLPFILYEAKINLLILGGLFIVSIFNFVDLLTYLLLFIPQRFSWFDVTATYGLLVLFIGYLIFFVIYKLTTWLRGKITGKALLLSFLFLIIFNACYIILYINEILTASFMVSKYQEDFASSIILTFLFAALITFIHVKNIIASNDKDKRIAVAYAQLLMQKEHIAEMVQKHQQISQISHDFKQHIHTLKGLSDSKNYEELAEILKILSKQQSSGSKPLITGNPMFDALLTIKREIAQRENILCDWKIMIPPNLPVQELDTCAVLGNALDNAIEACRKSKLAQPFITLDMYAESGWLLFRITNPIGQVPKIEKGMFLSSKTVPLKHGLGIKSMERCLESMGGNLEIFYDLDKFTLRFMLPLTAVRA
ncbi:MAG: GHKL domain-containing protein [Lachnospiraceae bacterium]|nr:GHKL domain-containing protein [Lachnospiraceae bacterium]